MEELKKKLDSHEKRLADGDTKMALLQQTLDGNTKLTEDIHKAIVGNGSVGLKTEVELQKAALGRAWWWLGGISIGLIGLACFAIRKGILS